VANIYQNCSYSYIKHSSGC